MKNQGLPPKVLRKGITDMIRISDARMSGAAYGAVGTVHGTSRLGLRHAAPLPVMGADTGTDLDFAGLSRCAGWQGFPLMKVALVGIGKIAVDQHVPAIQASADWELDATDRRILTVRQKQGRITNAELSVLVDLSPSACHRRVQRLEDEGFIAAYVALLDARRHRGFRPHPPPVSDPPARRGPDADQLCPADGGQDHGAGGVRGGGNPTLGRYRALPAKTA